MFGSDILDVAIGLSFVYLLLSLLATTIGELIALVSAQRASTLVDAIRNVLAITDDQPVAKTSDQPVAKTGDQLVGKKLDDLFWEIPLIKTLSPKGKPKGRIRSLFTLPGQGQGKPSYISSNFFALGLLEAVREQTGTGEFTTSEEVRFAIRALKDPEVRKLLIAVIGVDNKKTLEQTQKDLAKWFDEYMERVGGWYKRKAQVIALVLGLALAAILNVDSLTIANTLLTNPTLRASVVKIASDYVQNPSDTGQSDGGATGSVTDPKYLAEKVNRINDLQGTLASLRLPILWVPVDTKAVDLREVPSDPTGWIYKILGLLITGFLVSLGAPFWFDLLNQFVNLRSAGKAPQKVEEPKKAKDSSSDSGETPPRDKVIIPVVERPLPPSVNLDNLLSKAAQVVGTHKASGRLKSAADEDDVALQFLRSEVINEGLNVTDGQLIGAWASYRERWSNS